MMNSVTDTKQELSDCLKNFSKGSLLHNATELLRVLGYESEKTVLLSPNTVAEFQENFGDLHPEKAIIADWKSVDMVFQLTDDEIAMAGRSQPGLFADENIMDEGNIKSFLFLAVELSADMYTRTQLATITREINKLFRMPAIILFRHGVTLTLSVIDRREHKRDRNLDVLEKVTLIKDIRIDNPHRAHIEILFDLSIEYLKSTFTLSTFDELYNAWRKTLSASELNKRFYQELSNWYFWALREVDFPAQAGISDKENRATNVIRLITRLIFAWFMKEKSLLPEELFNEQKLRHNILKSLEPDESTFYQAILQNLFFATLNTEMDNATRPRKFRGEGAGNSRDQNYMVHSVYRHKTDFRNADDALQLFATIPFLNGGLFECLDKRVKRDDKEVEIRIDGFSDKPQKSSSVPNKVFFGEDHDIDLNEELGTKNKKYKVRGLIDILHSYKFTVDENTPIEEEIALDPELLGKVFENLLASYNPETGVAARKQTGSFYTPREIVGYMVDESLLAYFQNYLETAKVLSDKSTKALPENLRHLLAYNEEDPKFTESETTALIKAASEVKILDPACGSGAFPMGILHKLVFVLSKLDPGNIGWKEQQLARAERDLQRAHSMEDEEIRAKAVEEAKHRINEIRESFDNPNHEIDYLRKLYLIEHCIYGVDIQPIAMQISKLRFFISLVIDQKINDKAKNRGIRPLPNLETKLVAANTLLAIEKPVSNTQFTLRNPEIDAKESELKIVRERYFLARTPKTKERYRDDDKRLRDELGLLLLADGFLPETTEKLAHWDPYDQNTSAAFFDAEWMFGVKNGFDIAIGNPPYIQLQRDSGKLAKTFENQKYETFARSGDIYCLFYEVGMKVLSQNGVLCFITSNKWMRAGYGEKLRNFLVQETNPLRVIDFGGVQVFESATVDTNILITQKAPNKGMTLAAVVDKNLSSQQELSVYLRQNVSPAGFKKDNSWVVLSPIAQRIKEKVELVGTPLKDWDIQINYGIKTGFNEAFIIDEAKRQELIEKDPKSDEIIRPILRGRDIKRYAADWQRLYLIATHNGYTSTDGKWIGAVGAKEYPSIKAHLDSYWDKISERYDKGNTPYNLRSCNYWEDFNKQKLLWAETMRIHRNSTNRFPRFGIDETGNFVTDKTCFFATGDSLRYIMAVLNSAMGRYLCSRYVSILDDGGYLMQKIYIEKIPIPKSKQVSPLLINKLFSEKDTSKTETEIDIITFNSYHLTTDEIAFIKSNLQ